MSRNDYNHIRTRASSHHKRTPTWIEGLESRRLLSSTAGLSHIIEHTNLSYNRTAAAATTAAPSTTVQGYTPAQISKAYGLTGLTFSNGTLQGNGAGQTIAIVDAYNDPNIQKDLTTFDSQFGLSAPPSFKIENQSGGSTLPASNAGWAGEISLDVEWAHAMAPGANILLVEGTTDSLTDLLAAVQTARMAAGVSVVSMSWGGSEFFGWNGTEFQSETQYDSYFTTPAGHQSETFVVSAGDSGTSNGVQWPAASPNVVSVGGTGLTTSDSTGTYGGESSWSGTSGGVSQVEREPSFQNNTQAYGTRTVPDVAYDADPNTGFAVYDSMPYQGYSGWQEVGGTSAGSPQWASLIAIADQGRAAAGLGTLDGTNQVLPALYNLYTTNGQTYASTYNTNYNDVIDSQSGLYYWPFGGYGNSSPATTGYDIVTGIGTPKAATLISSLADVGTTSAINPTPTPTPTSSPTPTPTPTPTGTSSDLPASPIDGVLLKSPSGNVLEGARGTVQLQLQNVGNVAFSGSVTVTVYISSDATVSSGSTNEVVDNLTLSPLNLGLGKSKDMALHFKYPSDLASQNYYLVAVINVVGANDAPAYAASPASVSLSPPTIDLSTSFGGTGAVAINANGYSTAIVTITNVGNVTADGTISVNLYASTTGVLDGTQTPLLNSVPVRAIAVAAGKSRTYRIRFRAPAGVDPATYDLIAAITSNTSPADSNPLNDIAVAQAV